MKHQLHPPTFSPGAALFAAAVFLALLAFPAIGTDRAEAGVSLERTLPLKGLNDPVMAAAPAGEGAIYATTMFGTVFRMENGKRRKVIEDAALWAEDLAVGPDGSIFLLAEDAILRYSPEGKLRNRIGSWKRPEREKAGGGAALEVAPDGTILVAMQYEGVIKRYRPGGKFLGRWGSKAKLGYPADLTVEADGSVLVIDSNANRILRLGPDGKPAGRFGRPGWRSGQISNPAAVASDRQGHVFVADWDLNRIQAFTSDGKFIEQWGRTGSGKLNINWIQDLSASRPGTVLLTDMEGVREFMLTDSPATRYAGISAWTDNWNVWTRPGRVVRVPMRVVNFGNARARKVSYCYRPRLGSSGRVCRRLGGVAPGATRRFKIRVRVPKLKRLDFDGENYLSLDINVNVKSGNAGRSLALSQVWVKRPRQGRK